jgi:hypothetical protein
LYESERAHTSGYMLGPDLIPAIKATIDPPISADARTLTGWVIERARESAYNDVRDIVESSKAS